MNKYLIIALLILIVVLLIISNDGTKKIKIGGESYNVIANYPDAEEAANVLNELNERVMKFLMYVKKKYKINAVKQTEYDLPYPRRCVVVMNKLLENYNPEVIYENDPAANSSDTSFTIDKNKKLVLCLREKRPPYKLHSVDDLIFVLLHENAHQADYDENWEPHFQHTPHFWETFKFILYEAINAGIYVPRDYRERPFTYCGLYVNYNPYFDAGVRSIWLEN